MQVLMNAAGHDFCSATGGYDVIGIVAPSAGRGVAAVFDNHSHAIVAEGVRDLAEAIRLADEYAAKWMKKKTASPPCACGPIEKPEDSQRRLFHFECPGLELVSSTNSREPQKKKWARNRKQRAIGKLETLAKYGRGRFDALSTQHPDTRIRGRLESPPPAFLRITIMRISPRPLDSDNLAESAKALRDGIADALGVSDADPRIEWAYEQAPPELGRGRWSSRGKAVLYGVRVVATVLW